MAWVNGGPGSRIPAAVKREVRERDQTCQLAYPGCTVRIDEFDHIAGVAATKADRAATNTPDHLRGVCATCHKKRTQQQSLAARKRHLRRPYQHPGLR
ncbi:MAG: hypothetical protein K0U84_18315 [Actinomycetia bacterium]|nr:hypothetical protein [Actinomycetes bacterium]